MTSAKPPRHPEPWVLALVRSFEEDPVISLGRRDPPTHALVRTVYAGLAEEAIVEVELIDSPPPPSKPTYGGFFETVAFDAPSTPVERPWFVFDRWLSLAQNVDRLRSAARDHVLCTGRRECPPPCVDEVQDPIEVAARPSFDDLGHTQRRPSQSPPSRPPSGRGAPLPRSGSSPSSQRAPRTGPSSHRAPPRRRPAPPEPPPPAPPLPPEPFPAFGASSAQFGAPTSSQPQPAVRRPSSIPPPPPRRAPTGPLPPPPPLPLAAGSNPPPSGPVSGLPPPPPPPPPPPFGEDEI